VSPNKSLAGLTVIPAIPALLLAYLGFIGFTQAKGNLGYIMLATGICAALIAALPVYVMLFVGKKPKATAAGPDAVIAENAVVTKAAPAAAEADSAELSANDFEAADSSEDLDEVVAADSEEFDMMDDAEAFEEEEES
jgi:hypothetical protein